MLAAAIGCGAIAAPTATPTVAVLEFSNNGSEGLASLSAGIPDMLTTSLAASDGLTVVERLNIRKVVSEMTLGASGLVDPATAARIGKVAGADLVVMGSFLDLGRKLRIDAKVVEVETAAIVPGATHKVHAMSLEQVDVAVDTLAAALVLKLTGKPGAARGNPSRPGLIHFTASIGRVSGIMVDGTPVEPNDDFELRSSVSHGSHLIEVFRGAFKPVKLAEGRVFVPGGHLVRVRYDGATVRVHDISPLAHREDTGKSVVAPEEHRARREHEDRKHRSRAAAPAAMSAADFSAVVEAIEAESFERTRVSVMKSALQARHVSVAQLERLMPLFSFEQSRIDVARYIYPRLVNKDDFFRIYAHFTFSASKDELREWVARQ